LRSEENFGGSRIMQTKGTDMKATNVRWKTHRGFSQLWRFRTRVRGQCALRFIMGVVLLGPPMVYSQVSGVSSPPISPAEAMHLVEAIVPRLSITAIAHSDQGNRPLYRVEGKSGPDVYRAEVDSRIARVLSITKNQQPFYQWEGIIVVGHRGTVKFAPENTMSSFERAIELGADLLEMDVRETKDGHMVILHDDTVDRTTNGRGLVTDLTLQEIKALDAGSWFSPEFRGERVPTLKEVLAAIRGRALPDIDFKAGDPKKLIAILKEEDLLGKVTLYCGDWDLLQRTQQVSKEYFTRPTVPVGRIGLPILIREFDPPIVNMDWPQFSEGLVREVHLAGKKAFVNTMGPNDTEFGMIQGIDAGADYMQSDHLDILMSLLRARGLHR
jgi:glycerophosphoryl diester phosphodiesterase